jgi:hypothetical protein
VVLADLGEFVNPRGRLRRVGSASLPDQVTGLLLVATCRYGDGQIEKGGRCLSDRCGGSVSHERGGAHAVAVGPSCQTIQQAGELARFGQGFEDRPGVAGSGQVEQRGSVLGRDRLLVFFPGKLVERVGDCVGEQVIAAVG